MNAVLDEQRVIFYMTWNIFMVLLQAPDQLLTLFSGSL